MAFSQPLTDSVRRKGQSAMVCQLCETDFKLKWKCLDCKLMMCQRCRDKVHAKFSSMEDHTIIDIKEISKHQTHSQPQPDLTKLKCEEHKGQNCCLYCKTCKELVCQTCITKKHNKHDFGDISDEYNIKMEKIRNGQKLIENKMKTLTVSEQKLKQITSTEQSNFDKVKQEILDDDQALKNEIQKHTDKLLKELDQKWEAVSKTFENEKKNLKKNQSQIQKIIQEINTLLQPSNAKDVFSGSDSLFKSMEINISPVTSSCLGIPVFSQGDKTNISLILGKFEDVTISFSTELQVDKRFETDLNDITNVVYSPDDSLWICDYLSDRIQKVNPTGDSINVISDLTIDMYDAAIISSGDLLLSVYRSSKLKLIPSGSTDILDSVYTVSSLKPLGVHVTCDNKLIIEAVNDYKIHSKGPRQVMVMDQKGRHEKVFHYDRHNKPLFTYPRHITSNSQGNIAVVDMVSDDWKGRVVVLDQERGVRNIYTGHSDVNSDDNPFTPTGITTTPSDNFVVADYNNHTLHILNSEGEFITFYNTKEMGIILPRSLSFSTTGQLCIGCGTYENSKENAKLFTVNNFLY